MSIIKKRGQITLYIIVGIVILFIIGLIMALNNQNKSTINYIKDYNTDAVQLYFEKSLQIVTDECLYDVGLHGGYIDPAVAAFYGDSTIPATVTYTEYLGEKVPVYITGMDTYNYPDITQIEERLEKYILVKFQESVDLESFRKQGIYITGPDVNFSSGYVLTDLVSIDVQIRDKDIIVNLEYPLQIEKGSSSTIVKDFSYKAPFRFKLVYDAIVDGNKGLLDAISDKWRQVERMDNTFYLEDFDCDPLDPNHFINVYSLDNGVSDERIIRVIDYQNYFNTLHLQGYVYQFAVKKTPTQFSGNICKGTIVN
jgi:hypothetical protein